MNLEGNSLHAIKGLSLKFNGCRSHFKSNCHEKKNYPTMLHNQSLCCSFDRIAILGKLLKFFFSQPEITYAIFELFNYMFYFAAMSVHKFLTNVVHF